MSYSIYALRHRLARSDEPAIVKLRQTVKWMRNAALPAPRVVFVPILGAVLIVRSAYYALARILVCEPLFKAYCTRHGCNLKTGPFLHWVQGRGEIIIGDDVLVGGKSSFTFASLLAEPPRIEIGDRTIMGHDCSLTAARRITIGSDCLIAGGTQIMDSPGHPADPAKRLAKLPPDTTQIQPVAIGSNVWIGARATIFPGVTIGDGSVVGTGAVVMGNVPPNTVVMGNPARPVLKLDRDTAPTPPMTAPKS